MKYWIFENCNIEFAINFMAGLDKSERVSSIKTAIIEKLPHDNLIVLKYLVDFLFKVLKYLVDFLFKVGAGEFD